LQIYGLKMHVASSEAELARTKAVRDLLRREIAAIKSKRSWKLVSRLGPGGWQEQRRRKDDQKLASESGLFDRDWYLAHNPDVAANGQDPLTHYLQHGGLEGRDPGPDFASRWYLDQNPDVGARGVNPLIHYLRFGKKEGRNAKSSEGGKR